MCPSGGGGVSFRPVVYSSRIGRSFVSCGSFRARSFHLVSFRFVSGSGSFRRLVPFCCVSFRAGKTVRCLNDAVRLRFVLFRFVLLRFVSSFRAVALRFVRCWGDGQMFDAVQSSLIFDFDVLQ